MEFLVYMVCTLKMVTPVYSHSSKTYLEIIKLLIFCLKYGMVFGLHLLVIIEYFLCLIDIVLILQ